MITSALITECRRDFGDIKKSTRMIKTGDGTAKLFNTANFPIIESSYTVFKNTSAQVETTNYTLDKDTGDLLFVTAPLSAYVTKAEFKYAHWRDQHWLEAINDGIAALNARGFFKQTVHDRTSMRISANIKEYTGPTNCIDLYEVLESDDYTASGNFIRLSTNWSYHAETNKMILGNWPSRANRLEISFLKRLATYATTSATLDVPADYIPLVKKFAGAKFFKYLAAKTAREPHANIDEGHFSFSNLRTQAKDMVEEFHVEAQRTKPSRPAKELQYHITGGGVA